VQVSIILVNYNTCDLTINCINSIKNHSFGFTYEIIVVDNASQDMSAKLLSKIEGVKYIQNQTNAGFGTANNLGVKNSLGKFIFLLNSDTILIENSIKKLLDFYSDNEINLKIGALGCVLVDQNNNIINSGSYYPMSNYFLRSYLRLPIPVFKVDKGKEYQNIDFVTGADLFMSKKKYEEIGGFDESFFLYYEETDLQKRLNTKGNKNYIITTTQIIHLEGASDGANTKYSNFKRIIMEQSKYYFLRKHDRFYSLFIFAELPVIFLRLLKNDYTMSENKLYLKSIFKSLF